MSFDKTPFLTRAKNEDEQYVYKYYTPLQQRNIDGQRRGKGIQDKMKMDAFINAVGDRCDQYESSINGCSNDASAMAVCEAMDYSDISP